jgi:hypothetical protein
LNSESYGLFWNNYSVGFFFNLMFISHCHIFLVVADSDGR